MCVCMCMYVCMVRQNIIKLSCINKYMKILQICYYCYYYYYTGPKN